MAVQIQNRLSGYEPKNWSTWLKEGRQYLNAVAPDGKSSRFGADIRYNLLSISLECYVMAICDFHGRLPDNHTFTDLLDCLERVVPVDPELKERILEYENIQSICSIEKYHRNSQPSESDLAGLRQAVIQLSNMAQSVCRSES